MSSPLEKLRFLGCADWLPVGHRSTETSWLKTLVPARSPDSDRGSKTTIDRAAGCQQHCSDLECWKVSGSQDMAELQPRPQRPERDGAGDAMMQEQSVVE